MAHARKARTALGLAFRDSSFRLGRCSRCCFPLSDGDGATPGSIHIDERNKHFAVTHTCTEDGTFRSRWCESNSARTMRRRGGSVRYCQNSTPPARETTLRWLRSKRRERRRRGVGCSPSRRRSERRLVFPSRQQTTVVDSKRRSERDFLLLFFFSSAVNEDAVGWSVTWKNSGVPWSACEAEEAETTDSPRNRWWWAHDAPTYPPRDQDQEKQAAAASGGGGGARRPPQFSRSPPQSRFFTC